MVKKRHIFIFVFTLLLGVQLNAQSWKLMRYEFMVGVGTANIFGDITGTSSINNENLFGLKDIAFFDSRPSMVFALRYKLTDRFSSRLNLMYGYGVSSGQYNKDTESRESAIAKTHMVELSPQLEYYFLREGRKFKATVLFNRRGMLNSYATLSGYLFAGVGGLFYAPKIEEGWWKKSRIDWRTRNDGNQELFEDPGFTYVLPMGVGFKYIIDSRIVLGAELGGRFTGSDKIDGFVFDYQNRGTELYEPHNDVYFFSSLNVSYKLRTNKNNLPEFVRKDASKTGNIPYRSSNSARAKSASLAKSSAGDPKKSWREKRKEKRVAAPRDAKLGKPDPRKINPRKR